MPVMPDGLSPEYWYQRAEEARALASQLKDPTHRHTLQKIADDYAILAK
jgi:hypothetical protein